MDSLYTLIHCVDGTNARGSSVYSPSPPSFRHSVRTQFGIAVRDKLTIAHIAALHFEVALNDILRIAVRGTVGRVHCLSAPPQLAPHKIGDDAQSIEREHTECDEKVLSRKLNLRHPLRRRTSECTQGIGPPRRLIVDLTVGHGPGRRHKFGLKFMVRISRKLRFDGLDPLRLVTLVLHKLVVVAVVIMV